MKFAIICLLLACGTVIHAEDANYKLKSEPSECHCKKPCYCGCANGKVCDCAKQNNG